MKIEQLESRLVPNQIGETNILFQLINSDPTLLVSRHQDYPWPQQEIIYSEGRILWDLDIQRYDTFNYTLKRNSYTYDVSVGNLDLYGYDDNGNKITFGEKTIDPNGEATILDSDLNHFIGLENHIYTHLVYNQGLEVVEDIYPLKPIINQYNLQVLSPNTAGCLKNEQTGYAEIFTSTQYSNGDILTATLRFDLWNVTNQTFNIMRSETLYSRSSGYVYWHGSVSLNDYVGANGIAGRWLITGPRGPIENIHYYCSLS